MADMKWALWNCAGLLSGSSAQEKIDFLRAGVGCCWDVLVLVETHHKTMGDVQSTLNTYSNSCHVIHTGVGEGDPYAGIIVFIDKRFVLEGWAVLLPGRLINFKLKTSRAVYNVSAMYGYTGNSASQERMRTMTDGLLLHHRRGDRNLILGDFNFVDNDLDRSSASRVGLNQCDRSLCPPWCELVDDLDLADAFRHRNPRRRMFSYIHTVHNARSRIDRVYVSDSFSNDIVLYRHIHTPFIKAHRVVTFTLKEGVERGPGFWKMNTSRLGDRAYQIIIDRAVQDVLNLNIQDPIERWLVFIGTVRIETQVYCKRKRFYEKAIRTLCERRLEDLEQDPFLDQSSALGAEYDYYKSRLEDWMRTQVSGYQTRIKTCPKFEAGEPNVAFFAELEKKTSSKRGLRELRGEDGEVVHTTDGIKKVATDFYTDLFSTKKVDVKATEKLLNNVKKRISASQRDSLDRVITLEELEKAVRRLQRGKSPGPDGIPAEFYQLFWDKIKHLYLGFINAVKTSCFPEGKNVSVTTLIYKERGERFLLANYRPIALMNVDVKILTKLLSIRLSLVLPSIIHETQTAVYGRWIGDNVNLVRDLIDLANENNEDAALLFLDQEKAFDRVNHGVLLKTLGRFGFGAGFISWVKIIYSNAATRLDINGFLTARIPLLSGVRQGCPLSPLLYVLVIELLALRLRSNPNIVGFSVCGERIVSSHYSDDAVIKITQNRCFKEVYKDLGLYEMGTGAKVNYEKTKGLWLGCWRGRVDDPFEGLYTDTTQKIVWTSGNVKYLGIYVGNDEPDVLTFRDIVPKVKRRLNYWKPLALPVLSKARVVEIFLASKIWYAASFYPVPAHFEKEINAAFIDYIVFPKNRVEVNRMEMEKERGCGGIKLINVQLKSVTPKIHWLMRLLTDVSLKVHYSLFSSLVGDQKGGLRGSDLLFAEHSYVRRHVKCSSGFYLEALLGISKLDTWKHVPDVRDEHLYYNRVFSTTDDNELEERTVKPFYANETLGKIRTYGDLLDARDAVLQPRLAAVIGRKIESIVYIRQSVAAHEVMGRDHKPVDFKNITQKFIYSELVQWGSTDHIYQTKWFEREDFPLVDWSDVWGSVHQQFFTEAAKSTVWEQIHLNFYTTYNYNKWHGSLHPCPLCRKIPEDVFHVIVDCRFTVSMWGRIESVITKIVPIPPRAHERAFGLQPRTRREEDATILRNWVTFSLRHMIMEEERRAYYLPGYSSLRLDAFAKRFNFRMRRELMVKRHQYGFRGLQEKFDRIATFGGAVGTKVDDEYIWNDII